MIRNFLVFLGLAVASFAQVQMDRVRVKGLNQRLFADQFCNGSTDVGVCFANAVTALPNFPSCSATGNNCKSGVIDLGGFSGVAQRQGTAISITSPYLRIEGPGSANLEITCTVNGDCWNIRSNPFTITMGARFGGFSLIGQGSANANAVGIHTGDLTGAEFYDIQIDNFLGTNSACFWVDNQLGWFERNLIYRLQTGIHGGGTQSGCTKGRRFTVSGGSGSFGYNTWISDKTSLPQPNAIGWSFEAGNLYNNYIQTSGNASATTTWFSITAGTHTGNTLVAQIETTGSATGFSISGGGSFSYDGSVDRPTNMTDIGSPSAYITHDPLLQNLWSPNSSGIGGLNICNNGPSSANRVCIGRSFGAINNFNLSMLVNGYFDGTNWHFDTDGNNNGGFGIIAGYGGGGNFVNIPTDMPMRPQLIPEAKMRSFITARVDGSTGNWSFNHNVTAAGVTASGSSLTTLGQTTVRSLPPASSNPGAMVLVTDSTQITVEGQQCSGNSSNKAVAISNGSSWKCF